MSFNLNNIFDIKKAIKYLLGQVSSLTTQITNISNSAGVDYYEHTAYYNVSGTTLTLVRVVKSTVTDLAATAVVNPIRAGVGQYNFFVDNVGDVRDEMTVEVQNANSFNPHMTKAFPNYTGGSGTGANTMWFDDGGLASEVVGQFLVKIKIYK